MELILWRHAEAEDLSLNLPDDGARSLTDKGHKQAKRMAVWLNERMPADALVLASPAVRAQQTAAALKRDIRTMPEIGTGASPAALLRAAAWPRAAGVTVLVGHQPVLGEVVSLLLTGQSSPLSVKKGAIWWFCARERQGRMHAVLRASLAPDLL